MRGVFPQPCEGQAGGAHRCHGGERKGHGRCSQALTRLGWVLFNSWAKSSPLRAIEKDHARRAACQGGRAPGETGIGVRGAPTSGPEQGHCRGV